MKEKLLKKHLFRSSGRVVPPLAAGRSPTDEFFSEILFYFNIESLIS